MPDMEKVIKAYECCKNPFDRKCEKCPYEKDCCHDGIPMFVIKKMVELLKEQDKIIQNILREKTNELNNKVTTLRIESQNREMRRLLEQK